jgi:hypothetical protein
LTRLPAAHIASLAEALSRYWGHTSFGPLTRNQWHVEGGKGAGGPGQIAMFQIRPDPLAK